MSSHYIIQLKELFSRMFLLELPSNPKKALQLLTIGKFVFSLHHRYFSVFEKEHYNYRNAGAKGFNARKMLILILYSQVNNMKSCREIEDFISDSYLLKNFIIDKNIPSYKTINNYISKFNQNGNCIEEINAELINYINNSKLCEIDVTKTFIDGTKIEANANKYTFVWKNRIRKDYAKMMNKLLGIIAHISLHNPHCYGLQRFIELHEHSQKGAITRIENIYKAKEILDSAIASLSYLDIKYPIRCRKRNVDRTFWEYLRKLKGFKVRLDRYITQLELMGERNSMSKTDIDATFMRLKDDHMKNGQLKAAYNFQISTNNQFVLSTIVSQNTTDYNSLLPLMSHHSSLYKSKLNTVIADAGYSSQSNYSKVSEQDVVALIPYTMMRREQTAAYKKKKFVAANMQYIEDKDVIICPNNIALEPFNSFTKVKNSELIRITEYGNNDACLSCLHASNCTRSKNGKRTIQRNAVYESQKSKIRKLLLHDSDSQIMYSRRKIEPETVFGNIKGNMKANRLRHRGLDKVGVELSFYGLTHNLKRFCKILYDSIQISSLII